MNTISLFKGILSIPNNGEQNNTVTVFKRAVECIRAFCFASIYWPQYISSMAKIYCDIFLVFEVMLYWRRFVNLICEYFKQNCPEYNFPLIL